MPVSSIKFYLRRGLLPAGDKVPGRRAEYGEDHIARLRAVRSLVEDVGLALERVREILEPAADDDGFDRVSDLLGRRWMLAVVRVLLRGPARLTDLRRALPAPGSSVLTRRLRELEDAGLLSRERSAPQAAAVYRLTARGLALAPAVVFLERWGRQAS